MNKGELRHDGLKNVTNEITVCFKTHPTLRPYETFTLAPCRDSLSKPALCTTTPFPFFTTGDYVFVSRYSLHGQIVNKKLSPYSGPFCIHQFFPHNLYSMVNESGKLKVYRVSRLIPYYSHPFSNAVLEGELNVIC